MTGMHHIWKHRPKVKVDVEEAVGYLQYDLIVILTRESEVGIPELCRQGLKSDVYLCLPMSATSVPFVVLYHLLRRPSTFCHPGKFWCCEDHHSVHGFGVGNDNFRCVHPPNLEA